jgi:hypothetical protein
VNLLNTNTREKTNAVGSFLRNVKELWILTIPCPEEIYGATVSRVSSLRLPRGLPQDVTCFTLKPYWGARDSVLVRRDLGNAAWERIKRATKNYYLSTKDETPDETDFEIWIRSGDPSAGCRGEEGRERLERNILGFRFRSPSRVRVDFVSHDKGKHLAVMCARVVIAV